eukprot:TRINITY_DN16239_c0_g1_i1.p1 TRINITY_DN16239_c0_g1~~TRINITY_DN16239_c0_g1_i1.p1  ORF type:complete len:825 (+),score=202.25 TRINITY_DN16239_c0_g1_i1:75-2477(+)
MSKDSKYFTTTKRGEIPELKEELDSPKEEKKKEALKKVIAAMTLGKDVSMLFLDVLKCMTTKNLELKKLIYLYIMNYAKSQPDLAILAVNTFVKDASSTNPLIRALAVRTMGCIRVDKITEYLCQPLAKCLKDEDPYVRKTAAVCVAKLYDINPELVMDQGFVTKLQDLLLDSNPMVVANAVAALNEIEETSKSGLFTVSSANLNKLLAALNECTEWGQIFILNSLSNITPRDAREAENLCERVVSRLAHSNSAVVLGTIKVLLKNMDLIQNQELLKGLIKKMAPPLVTLLSKEPEIQYVALRNINLIVQKRPAILQNEVRMFFCKFNDPIYVKMEKLEIMIMLVSEKNIDQVLLEFKEYATEVDVEFVRKAVRAIGRCAIKLEGAAQRCIQVLVELIHSKVNYVVQEAVIVIKDIFRKYPNQYESVITTLCENLDTLDEPEAKAAMIWIVGEYAHRIDNAHELLQQFSDTFHDESPQVQLQILTSTVKLFLKRPKTAQTLVQTVLNLATKETDNPDLRDRGFIYWRLLSTDPQAAKTVVLSEKPLISDDTSTLEPSLLDELISHISTLASVYHKPPEIFITKLRKQKVKSYKPKKTLPLSEEEQGLTTPGTAVKQGGGLIDLLDIGDALPTISSTQGQPQGARQAQGTGIGSGLDVLGDLGSFSSVASAPPGKELLLSAEKGKGLQIHGAFNKRNGTVYLDLSLANLSQNQLSDFGIVFNKNPLRLVPTGPMAVGVLRAGSRVDVPVSVGNNGPEYPLGSPQTNVLQIAIKAGADVFYFQTSLPRNLFSNTTSFEDSLL